MTTRADIVAIARAMLGVRFAHQGRDPREGLDCLGFLFAVADKAGITLRGNSVFTFDRRDYGARPDTVSLRQQLETLLLPVTQAEVADILLLNIGGRPQHLALVSDHALGLGIIHAYAPARKVVEHRLDAYWQRAIAGVYRIQSNN